MLKAVIFDVGGVLIRTHSRVGRERWARRFELDPWQFESFIFGGESGRAAQLGQKTEQAHWQWLGAHFKLSEAELAEMRRDFFAGDALNEPLLAYIRRLKQGGYRLGLLSNFGDGARRLWREEYPFIDYFEGVVISAEVGLMKPDPRIYYLAAESLAVEPAEALFVDDFSENVTGARAVGMRAIHFTEPEVVLRELAAATGIE